MFRRCGGEGRPTPFLLFPFEREETGGTVAPAASCFPLVATSGALPRLPPRFIRHRRRFGAIHASKEEKGACCDIVPLYSQTELFAQCAGSAGARFLELADACCGHCAKRHLIYFSPSRKVSLTADSFPSRGSLWRPRPQARNSPTNNVRGRHHARRNVVPPGRRHIAVSVQLRKTAYPTGQKPNWPS